MAPYERNEDGFWGNVTATIDWCEANYEVSYYFAEFWNTVSNVFLIIPPLVGAIIAYLDGMESRYVCCHLSLMVVGIGSWCFHGTLLYEMQLLDELPMIWGSACLIYSIAQVDIKQGKSNTLMQVVLFLYCLTVTVVYLVLDMPIFHQIAYALMVTAMVVYSCRICWFFESSSKMFFLGLLIYLCGFLVWNIDNIYCSQLRMLRGHVGYPLKPLLQGHAWWHILTGTGTYVGLLFCMHARARYLKQSARIKWFCQAWPYLRVSQQQKD